MSETWVELAADIREIDGDHTMGTAQLGYELAERGWYKPRRITELDELAALPDGSIIQGTPDNVCTGLVGELYTDLKMSWEEGCNVRRRRVSWAGHSGTDEISGWMLPTFVLHEPKEKNHD